LDPNSITLVKSIIAQNNLAFRLYKLGQNMPPNKFGIISMVGLSTIQNGSLEGSANLALATPL
jgi:hypothetical protein